MEMVLKTTYKIKAIPLIRNFVEDVALYYGATTAESTGLKLAAEEAAEHIISNYPQEQGDFFEIFCRVENDTFRVILSNMGLPVNKDEIPGYKVEDPSGSIDGLKFFMIKKLTDNFYFLNLGAGGWQTVLEKKLLSLGNIETEDDKDEDSETEAIDRGRESLEISVATPDDAFEITKLAYFTYRYSYAKTVFYYPEVLKEAIRTKSVIPFIAKNARGEIVIQSAFLRSPYSHDIVESGALMSNPEYRKNSGLIRIIKKQIEFALNKDNEILIVESNLVTAHTGSQRITKINNFFPFALKISTHERGKFVAMENIHSQRETILYALWTPFSLDKVTFNVPVIHHAFLKSVFKNAGLSFEPRYNIVDTGDERSVFNIYKNSSDKLAVITIESFGKDWNIELKKLVRDLAADNFITFHLKIRGWHSLPSDVEELLNRNEFFFSGVIPNTPYKWMLQYTRVDNQIVDFSKILTYGKEADNLKSYVELCYNNVLNN